MHYFSILALVASSFIFLASGHAAPANLPETGQSSCTNSEGIIVACQDTGQDADYRAGVAWPAPRFSVDATGDCLIDNLTRLMWVRSPEINSMTWRQALDLANNLTVCNTSDWRLPNINELESMLNLDAADQAVFLNSEGFSGIQASGYWTSSNYWGPGSSDLAWLVFFNDGRMFPDRKSAAYPAWPVRTAQ